MAYYFSHFPTIQYNSSGVSSKVKTNVSVTDITKRFKITQLLNGVEVYYYDYEIQSGDRPDTIAYKLYGSAKLDWIVLLVNEIHDRYFEWALSDDEFVEFINKQYGSVGTAQNTVHHYEQIIQAKQTLSDGTIVQERTVNVDETTYNSLTPSSRRLVSTYDQEEKTNESHRRIKLVDKQFVPRILRLAGRAYS